MKLSSYTTALRQERLFPDKRGYSKLYICTHKGWGVWPAICVVSVMPTLSVTPAQLMRPEICPMY